MALWSVAKEALAIANNLAELKIPSSPPIIYADALATSCVIKFTKYIPCEDYPTSLCSLVTERFKKGLLCV